MEFKSKPPSYSSSSQVGKAGMPPLFALVKICPVREIPPTTNAEFSTSQNRISSRSECLVPKPAILRATRYVASHNRRRNRSALELCHSASTKHQGWKNMLVIERPDMRERPPR